MATSRGLRTARTLPDVLILFPDDWAAYSPTLLHLVDLLTESFRVRAHVLDTGRVDNSVLDTARFRCIRTPGALARLLKKTGTFRPYRAAALAWSARRDAGPATRIIAVDADGAVAACLMRRPFHLLSLEVGRHPLLRWLVRRLARSITIQSPERLHYQFGAELSSRLRVFYVQNAPEVASPPPIRSPNREHPRLVYLGHILPMHGLAAMLELVRAWPHATLTLAGLRSAAGMTMIKTHGTDLIDTGRLILWDDYVPEAALPEFLGQFDIGLCLYELGRRRDFNYLSSPAGKMFNYFSAGLPVVASDMIGLNPVSLYQAGIQVPSHQAQALLDACHAILSDYERYSAGAARAAVHYDFRRAAAPLVAFLQDPADTP